VAVALAVALAGCTFTVRGPDDVVVTETPDTSEADAAALAAEWAAEYETFVAEYGAEAVGIELTDDDARAAAAAAADRSWQRLQEQFPDAVRPAAQFVAWTTDTPDPESPLVRCLEDAGIVIDRGTDENGESSGIGWSAEASEQMLAAFVCVDVAYPHRPKNLPVFLDWVWNYNTHFLRPCLEAHGLPQEPIPDHDEYITASIGWAVHWSEDWETDMGAEPDPAVAADCRYRQ